MWEKLNKIQVQVIVSIIVILGCFIFLFLLMTIPVPARNEKLIDVLGGIIIGSSLTGVIGWLFTQSKQHSKPTNNI